MSPPHPLSYRETFKLCSLMYPRITRTVPGTCVKKWNFIEWISDCPTQHPRCFYHPGFLPPSLCPFFKLESTQHSFSQPLTLWLLLLRLAAEISWRKSQRPAKEILHKITLLNSRVTSLMTNNLRGLPRWLRGKEPTCHAGDRRSVPGSRRPPGEGNGNPLQCCSLENPMDRGAWRATVHGLAKELGTT